MFRLTSFLKRAPGVSRDDFVRGWVGEISDRTVDHPAFKRSVRTYIANLPFAQVPAEFLWIACDDFDGVAELWFDDLPAAVVATNALAADQGIADAASRLIDAENSISWIGQAIEDFDRGGASVKRIVAGQAKPELTLEEAQDYWLHEHSDFFKAYEELMSYMLSYRPLYGIPTPGLKLRSHHLMAMCADVGFRSLQDLHDAYSEQTHATAMMEELARFGASSGAITFTASEERLIHGRRPGVS